MSALGQPFSLHQIAPRLARARDARVAELAVLAQRERELVDAKLRFEWLVAHRQLQLARAYARGNGRYIWRRQGKLKVAEEWLADVTEELRRVRERRG